MFRALARKFRAFRARCRLIVPGLAGFPNAFAAKELQFPELVETQQRGGPELPPYSELAFFWDDANRARAWDYPSYLQHLAYEHGLQWRAVLDLACGAGALTDRLAAIAGEVVAADASEAMLARARSRCLGHANVTFLHADFRALPADRRFDAVVCSGDSLNYVADVSELTAAFRAVAAVLEPGGWFLFDVSTTYGMKRSSGHIVHLTQGDRHAAIAYGYDPITRSAESRVYFVNGIETHRRIPLDLADVRAGLSGTGLAIDHFFFGPMSSYMERTSSTTGWYVVRKLGP